MKKICIMLAVLMAGAFTFQSCEDMDDTNVPVYDFIWKGMNLYYLWKDEVPDLHDDRFANQDQLNSYLEGFSSPESLFESLIYQRDAVDKWSVIVPDFIALENLLQGVAKSNGVEFGLKYVQGSETDIYGYVRYIMPNSDASNKDIHRGDIFYAVNGTPLTVSNYRSLLGADSYSLNLATYNAGVITPTGEEVFLVKTEYAENPVLVANVIEEDGRKIGYLMYNGFYSSYDSELNAAFAYFAAEGIDDLVLDLRYNSGGSTRTASYLASMITGQFDGFIFSRRQWNTTIQNYYLANQPAALNELFATELSNGTPINSLELPRVYILTSPSTASASELLINCLDPYITVKVIGDTTTGKNVASITLYDSPDFSRNNVDGSHRYAMQPIVLRTLNENGFGNYSNGIAPDTMLQEDMGNLGQLGNPDEPLLAAAISQITGTGRRVYNPDNATRNFRDSKNMKRFGTEMYIEDVPEGTLQLLKNLQ